MKKRIAIRLIMFCSKKALKYENRTQMLLGRAESIKYLYAIGINAHYRDKWLKRILWLEKFIGKD